VLSARSVTIQSACESGFDLSPIFPLVTSSVQA
jgi:hypothetical protein